MTLDADTFDETFYFQLLEIPTAAARAEAKKEILALFSEEPDDEHEWTEQDIYEQARKIIQKGVHEEPLYTVRVSGEKR